MGYGMFGCPPGAVGARRFGGLWQPVAGCGSLWRAVPPDWMPLIKSLETSMPAGWRPEASMPGCNIWLAGWLGWLAGLAGWLGWLAWLAWLAGLAGWLGWLAAAGGLLVGCCWLAAAG